MIKRTVFLAVLAVGLTIAATPGPAAAAFHIVDLEAGFYDAGGGPDRQAAAHPNTGLTHIQLGSKGLFAPDGSVRTVIVDLPPGLIANPTGTPAVCTHEQLLSGSFSFDCPVSSQIGTAKVFFAGFGPDQILPPGNPEFFPLYNMVPAPGSPATLAFSAIGVTVTIVPRLRSEGDYGISTDVPGIAQWSPIVGSEIELWGVPADPGHDPLRYCRNADLLVAGAFGCETDAERTPFLTHPSNCSANSPITFSFDSWQEPGKFISQTLTADKDAVPLTFEDCEDVPFAPTISTGLSAESAETASGLEINLDVPDDGILNPDGLAQAHVKKAEVTLPDGVTINASVAEGLRVCTPAQYAAETATSAPGAACPNGSRIGAVDIKSPLLNEHLTGSLYLAQQDDPATGAKGAENPFDSLIALYIVAKNEERGVIVKLPGKVEPDPRTGQLVGIFDDLPQLPFSRFTLRFREGGRAPLVSPPACGTYETRAELTPWSAADPGNPTAAEVRTLSSPVQITSGVGGGPCPSGGVPPFKPDFSAGSVNNNAGSFTPFALRLIRNDGEQDMTKFNATLPPGVLGKLAGVSKCPEAAIALARAKTGRAEIASPSCPANSQIGSTLAGAGVGSVLTYVPGKIYLGGPYNGAPLSVIAITSAVAGPFDVGTVVVRQALNLNPTTAEVEVDGSRSDPIPHILAGIPLKVRDLRVYIDRESFILNPTSCDPSSVKATLFGSFLDVFDTADDVPTNLATRFQAANCANLGFKPKLSIKLTGGTKRGAFPGLRAVLRARPGDANIGRASVTLPSSAFLAQEHLANICTRVQFAKDQCPKASIYGFAKAFTPLLDEPVQGPVYLRSSSNKLPDLVVDLHGLVDVEIASRIDSVRLKGAEAAGIRSTFASVPDAPVTKFILRMQGGKKGLIVNSTNLCKGTNRAVARFVGQNGKPHNFRPVVKPVGCGKGRKGQKRKGGR